MRYPISGVHSMHVLLASILCMRGIYYTPIKFYYLLFFVFYFDRGYIEQTTEGILCSQALIASIVSRLHGPYMGGSDFRAARNTM